MATRNLTKRFLQQRQQRRFGNKGKGAFNDDIPLVGSRITIPPQWVDVTTDIQDLMSEIRRKMQQLSSMHHKHLVNPGFDDEKTGDEHAIEILTSEISRMFSQAQHKVKNLSAPEMSHSGEEGKVTKNVQASLALQLQDLSAMFKRSQQSYMNKLRGQEERTKEFGIPLASFDNKPNEGYVDRGFSTRQQALVAESDRMIDERHEAIEKIATSIYELAEIFKDLNTLVIEQGTILDSIEYNIDQTVAHTAKARVELVKANKYQKSYRTKLCILLLLVLILALSIVLIVGKK